MKALSFWRTILTVKVLLWAAALFAMIGFDFNAIEFRSAFARWPDNETPIFTARLATWDSAHYMLLSTDGYQSGSPSCAFYPFWPLVIRATSYVTKIGTLVSSLLLANAFSMFGCWMFLRLIRIHDKNLQVRDALIFFLAFPGALFFSFPYTESLYFAMVMAFFWALAQRHYFYMTFLSLLLPLTRAVGVFILLPFLWHLYEERKSWQHYLLLSAPIVGYGAYFGLMHIWTGNAFEGFEAQKEYPYSPSIKNMFDLPAFWSAFMNVSSVGGMMDSALDRGFFLLFLAFLPAVWRLNKTWFWYTLPTGLVPAMTSYFMSYRRYIMVLFPLFIVLAQLTVKGPRWVFWYYVILLAALQAWAVMRFVNFNWAG